MKILNKKIWKRLAGAVAFGMGIVTMLSVSSHVFEPKSNAKDMGIEEAEANGIMGEKENSIDVVVLGDSESYSALNPLQLWDETGYAMYICGTSGQTLDYSETMLKRCFSRQSPKVVILETNAIFRKINLTSSLITRLSDHFTVFRYHNRWKQLRTSDFMDSIEYAWSDKMKGFRYSSEVVPGDSKGYMKESDGVAKIASLNRDYVERIKNYCEENGARLILVSSPSTVNWNYKRHNAVQKMASTLECEYIDMNLLTGEIPIDWEKDTRDKGDHLNYFGATKVTKYLSTYLADSGLLTSHKDDAEYESWNKLYRDFQEAHNKKISASVK